MSQNDFHLHFPHNFNSSSRKVIRTGEFTCNRMVTPLQIPFTNLQGIIILQQKGEESRRENCKSNLKPRDLKGLITFLSSQGFSLFGLSFPSDMCIIRCHISLPGLDVKQQTVLVAFGIHDDLQVRFLQCPVAQELLMPANKDRQNATGWKNTQRVALSTLRGSWTCTCVSECGDVQ